MTRPPVLVAAAGLLLLVRECGAATLPYPSAPTVVRHPAAAVLFGPDADPFRLECEADAGPEPTYLWFKDGREFDHASHPGRIRMLDGRGTLLFEVPEKADEGVYQCFAENAHGVAISDEASVRRTEIGSFPDEPPKEVFAIEGKPLSLVCNPPPGYPKPEIDWIIQSNISTFSDIDSCRVSVDPEGTLHFSNVTRGDAPPSALYACSARSPALGEKRLGNRIALRIEPAEGPTATFPITKQYGSPSEMVVLRGDTVELVCIFGGTPMPEISWVRNGSSPSGDRFSYADYGRTLRIRSADFADDGDYRCIASNGVGDAKHHSVRLAVQVAPFWTSAVADGVGFAGGNASFSCQAGGIPAPEVRWMVNGVPVEDSDANARMFLDSGRTSLTLVDLNETDSAVFQCGAANAHGSLLHNFHLIVLGNDTSSGDRVTRDTGSSAAFDCPRDPEATLRLRWLFQDRVVDADRSPRLSLTEGGALSISGVAPADSGTYACLLTTEEGWKVAARVRLVVRDVPGPPAVTGVECLGWSALVRWRDGADGGAPIAGYALQANAGFEPDAWETVAEDIRHRNYTVTLSPWANYTFRVVAASEVGRGAPSAPSETCASSEDVPHKNPDQVRGRGTTKTNLVISWNAMPPIEHNAPGFFYRALWRREGEADWSAEEVRDWRTSELVVPDQPSFARYLVRVEAHNARGRADEEAKEVVGYSGEDVPLEAPQNLTCLSVVDSRTAILAWTPVDPRSLRGHFKGYKVQAWTEGDDESSLWEETVPPLVNQSSVRMFRPASTHRVRMLAFNDKYLGPPSDVIEVATPEGTPGSVERFDASPLGSSALYLTWKPPLETNGDLTGYRLYFSKLQGTSLGVMQEASPPVTDPRQLHGIVGNLQPDTRYRITIRATTGVGEGQSYFLEARTRQPPETLPDEPDFNYLWIRNMTGLKVTWTPDLKGNPGSYFLVQYRKYGELEWATVGPEKHRDFVHVLGLEPDSHYELKVVAADGGFTTPSRVVEIDTAELPPIETLVKNPAGT